MHLIMEKKESAKRKRVRGGRLGQEKFRVALQGRGDKTEESPVQN